jgi:hypothetical protein
MPYPANEEAEEMSMDESNDHCFVLGHLQSVNQLTVCIHTRKGANLVNTDQGRHGRLVVLNVCQSKRTEATSLFYSWVAHQSCLRYRVTAMYSFFMGLSAHDYHESLLTVEIASFKRVSLPIVCTKERNTNLE